ncbi:MAG: hypothetical protein ACLQGV_18880 [Bryobacteraceae bacterium]
MPLPEILRVKLSSEAAGYISVTRVVVQEMPLRALVALMLGLTGKDAGRVRELLLRGTLVSGGSRFRWTGWDAEIDALESLLATFPDPEPERAFSSERAICAVLRGPGGRIEVTREAGAPRRFLHGRSFWTVLMELAAAAAPRYIEYSYKHRADCYRVEPAPAAVALLRQNAGALKYSTLESQVRQAVVEAIDLYVAREG